MDKWTKEAALKELDALVDIIERLRGERRFSALHTQWLTRTLTFLEEVFGPESRYYLTFASFKWGITGTIMVGGPADPEGSWNPQKAVERRHQEAYLEQLETARGLLLAARDHLKRVGLDAVYQGKDTGPESSAIMKVINLAERKLRKVIRAKPTKEKEVQDAFESLLIGADISYSREKESIEYSSKAYIPDFTMEKIDLAMDLKLCSHDTREKDIVAEINDDILAYQTKYGNLFFIIYDLGFIRDVDRFIDSFEKHQNVFVRVVKH